MSGSTSPPIAEYRLRLNVDVEALRWTGTVECDLGAPGPTTELDVEGLRVEAVRENGRSVQFEVDRPAARLTVYHGPRRGEPISIDFSGEVEKDSLFGFYRSRHGDGYVLTTHCEPTGARRIFPCVDRPDRKARIVLTVRTSPDLEVISNSPVVSSRTVDHQREWTFAPTPPMSTYLFYLGVGRFDRTEASGGPVAIRVLTPPGRGEAGRFAVGAAGKILQAYGEYYGIPYPLPKLDLIAIAEHAFGAMENWGAISFQETRLLVDRSSSSFAARDVFETIAHEIAHQWFGNLVTMAWWDDIWLNESFASLMETKITERIDPALDARADFFLRVAGMSAAMDGDSLTSTHPVRAPVERPEELSQIFDEISYGKGSSVLAMLDAFLGEEAFRSGVAAYLNRHRFGNARTDDLWAELERSSGQAVGRVARPWIDRPGLPVVHARLGPDGLRLEQRRYAYFGSTAADPWPIPMVVDVDGDPRRILFDQPRATVSIPSTATVHLNPGAVGFYRVLYDRPLLDRLEAGFARRPAPDRWAVLEDLAAFLVSGETDWATYGRFVRAVESTADRLVVESLADTLSTFALTVPAAGTVQELAKGFLTRQTDRLGLDPRPGEAATEGVLRDRVAFARVRIDDEFARELARRYPQWDGIDPDLRSAVAVAWARADGEAGFSRLLRARQDSASAVEALRLERGLGWSSNAERVRDALRLSVSGDVNRSHILSVILQASANPVGRPVVWPWLTHHAARLDELFRGSGYLSLVFEHALPFAGLGRTREVEEYFAAHPYPEGTRGIAKGLERLRVAERLVDRLTGARTS